MTARYQCYRPAVFFRHFPLIALSFLQRNPRRIFKIYYYCTFLVFKNCVIRIASVKANGNLHTPLTLHCGKGSRHPLDRKLDQSQSQNGLGAKRIVFYPTGNGTQIIQFINKHYTDWDIPVPVSAKYTTQMLLPVEHSSSRSRC